MNVLCHWTVGSAAQENTVIQSQSVNLNVNLHDSFLSSVINLLIHVYVDHGHIVGPLSQEQLAVTESAMKLKADRPALSHRVTQRGRSRARASPSQIISEYLSKVFAQASGNNSVVDKEIRIPVLLFKHIRGMEDDDHGKIVQILADDSAEWEVLLDRKDFMGRGGQLLVRLDFLAIPDILIPSSNDPYSMSFDHLLEHKIVTYKFDDEDEENEGETRELRSIRPVIVGDNNPRHIWNMRSNRAKEFDFLGIVFTQKYSTEYVRIGWNLRDVSQGVIENGNSDLRASFGSDFVEERVDSVWYGNVDKHGKKKGKFRADGNDWVGISFEFLGDLDEMKKDCEVCLWKNQRKLCGIHFGNTLPDPLLWMFEYDSKVIAGRAVLDIRCHDSFFDVRVESL